MAPEITTAKHLVGLPLLVVGQVDVGRLLRELDMINNALLEIEIRAKGQSVELPKTSRMMEQTVALNKLNLLLPADRTQLQELLELVKSQAPMLHISFSADPDAAFIEKLMTWLRREIHPLVLLSIGLQPNLGAGCVVRSTNKYFDCSLRHDFLDKRDLLMSKLVGDPETVPQPQEQPA